MSQVYHTEPPTQGKVLLKTTAGDIDIELWPKEAPLACRNFIQLALEGYYDNCSFHRIIKEFMVQTGDPTGTGAGGESIWGRPFRDEIHGRIKFNHRGQVAMANENKPNTNQSQFFITLGPCDWIDRKHTIFGKVTGNTIYNVVRMGEFEVDSKDRPLEPIIVKTAEVLWNPFDDIVPRVSKKAAATEAASTEPAKPSRKSVKDKKLLSFGDEVDESESIDAAAPVKRFHSSHDSVSKDSKLSSQVSEELLDIVQLVDSQRTDTEGKDRSGDSNRREKISDHDTAEDFGTRMAKQMLERRKVFEKQGSKSGSKSGLKSTDLAHGSDSEDEKPKSTSKSQSLPTRQSSEMDSVAESEYLQALVASTKAANQSNAVKEKVAEFARVKEELLRAKRAVQVLTGADAEKARQDVAERNLLNPLEQRRQKYIKRRNEHGSRQDETLAKLKQFTDSIRKEKRQVSATDGISADEPVAPHAAESYHGQIFNYSDDEEEDGQANVAPKRPRTNDSDEEGNTGNKGNNDEEDDGGVSMPWHAGKLKFRKHIDDQFRANAGSASVGGDGRPTDDYITIDPRRAKGADTAHKGRV